MKDTHMHHTHTHTLGIKFISSANGQGCGDRRHGRPSLPHPTTRGSPQSGVRIPTSLVQTDPGAVPGHDGADEPPKGAQVTLQIPAGHTLQR